MTSPTMSASFYADFKSLDALKLSAKQDNPQALRGAAQQFESLFTTMMLKSMREATASVSESIGQGHDLEFYQSMYDQQIASSLSKGKGLGLADMLVQQLTRSGMVRAPSADATAPIPKPVESATRPASNAEKSGGADTQSTAAVSTSAPLKSAGIQHSRQSPAEFVAKMWPHVQEAAKKLGVAPATLIAHAALETGWGKHIPKHGDGSSSHNLFGIKAGTRWRGNSVTANTTEIEGGTPVKASACFRSYDSLQQCFADYADLLASRPRYGQALNTGADVMQFASALQKGGYATDPNYAHKLSAVAKNVSQLVASIARQATVQYANAAQPNHASADKG